MSSSATQSTWAVLLLGLVSLVGCTAPDYLTVPPADPAHEQYRGLSPSLPSQAVVRDQHLGQLQAEMRYLEEVVLRAEEERLQTCRLPEASEVGSVAYQRCQFKDQLYEQLKTQAAMARKHYLRVVSGSGGTPR